MDESGGGGRFAEDTRHLLHSTGRLLVTRQVAEGEGVVGLPVWRHIVMPQ
jgi:hypothetical protein